MKFIFYYQKYKHKIYNYFLYRVGFNQELAQDLTSEVFLKAYENFDNFDKSRDFQPWIYTIAHNHLVNYYRKNKPEYSLDDNYWEIPDEKTWNKITTNSEITLLLKKIYQLPIQSREVVIGRFIQGLEFKDLAKLLGTSEGNVRVILHRAINKLKNETK